MPIGRRWIELFILASFLMVCAAPGGAETDGKKATAVSTRVATAADLERMEEQDRRIEQLESSLRAVQDRLDGAEEGSVQTGSDEGTDDADGDWVDREYVDGRIEDFENATTSRFMISGYGTTGLVAVKDGETAFSVSFNPGFHFRMADELHLNAELEMEYEANDMGEMEFEIDLEFAQFDYLATDWLVVSGGRFLTPFNTFGTRLHPTWINKLSSPPPIYGGHGSGGFIPVMKTIGAMASGGKALWSDDAKINYAFFVGNGPTGEDLSDPPDEDELLDGVDFNNTLDLDDGVMVGGRLGLLPIRNLEFGVSYSTSNPNDVRFHLIGVDFWYNCEGLELRGEYAYLDRDDGPVDANVQGYWIQAAYRLNRIFTERTGMRGFANRLEPVVRFGQVSKFADKNGDQVAVGLNYWLFESAPLKLSYEFNDGAVTDDRFLINFAYGF